MNRTVLHNFSETLLPQRRDQITSLYLEVLFSKISLAEAEASGPQPPSQEWVDICHESVRFEGLRTLCLRLSARFTWVPDLLLSSEQEEVLLAPAQVLSPAILHIEVTWSLAAGESPKYLYPLHRGLRMGGSRLWPSWQTRIPMKSEFIRLQNDGRGPNRIGTFVVPLRSDVLVA